MLAELADGTDGGADTGVISGRLSPVDVWLVPDDEVESKSIRFLTDGVLVGLPVDTTRRTGIDGGDGLTNCCNVPKSGRDTPDADLVNEEPKIADGT